MKPRWTRVLLAVLLVGQLFLLAAQTPARGGDSQTLLASVTLRLLGPFARLSAATGEVVRGAREATRGRAELARENRRLRVELLELRRDRLRLAALEQEATALARGVDFARESPWRLRAAEVVYLDHASWLKTMLLHVGPAGARLDQPVITEAGVVGRVIGAAGGYAKVQLVTDGAAHVGAVLERARRQAIARGAGAGRMTLEFVPRQIAVEVGDRVLTAGIDGVYPRGIPLGTVSSVAPGSELFHAIEIEPAADLARLSFVYLIERETPPAALRSEAGDGLR